MTEIGNLGEIRKRYKPLRERTEKILTDSGIPENTPQYKIARKKFTREAYLAGIDEVTKLPVRSGFESRLQEEYARSERGKKPLTMALIDLNYLKKINSEGGLPAGDTALREVASQILRSIRRTDYAARYGGDEFAILFPEAKADDIKKWWDRFNEGMEQTQYTITASAMNITRQTDEETRFTLSDMVKKTKEQNNHNVNAFLLVE